MIPESTTKLEQRAFMRGYQSFEICSKEELEVTIKRAHTRSQFKVPLLNVNPSFTRVKYIQPGSLVGAIIFGAGTLVAVWGMIRMWNGLGAAAVMGFPLILFGGICWSCIWRLRNTSVNATVVHFRSGKGQLLLWHNNPDPNTFKSFCETLAKSAEDAWNGRLLDAAPQTLAGEIAALKKLKDSGTLSEAEFDRAKTKLLEHTEHRRIGFA